MDAVVVVDRNLLLDGEAFGDRALYLFEKRFHEEVYLIVN